MALTYREWLREHPDGRRAAWLNYLRELPDPAQAANNRALSTDEAHVLLDVIESWRPNTDTPPWTGYDEDPGDPKTTMTGWYALLKSAESTLTALLNKVPRQGTTMTTTPASETVLNCAPERLYTREEVLNAINAVASLAQQHEYEDADTVRTDDTVNLAAAAASYLLDHPNATLEEIITASYSDIELDADDFADSELALGPAGVIIPGEGSPAWNAAAVRKVLGWLT
jgi:hypothetical protein